MFRTRLAAPFLALFSPLLRLPTTSCALLPNPSLGEDIYMETSIELPDKAAHIVRFEPQAEMSVVHHMLLYLCTGGAAVRQRLPPVAHSALSSASFPPCGKRSATASQLTCPYVPVAGPCSLSIPLSPSSPPSRAGRSAAV